MPSLAYQIFAKSSLKRISKKVVAKGPIMEAYKDHINKEKTTIDPIILNSVNSQGEYSIGPTYKITNNSLAYPFDRSGNSLFLEKPKVDLSMWFESKKPLVIWPLVKKEFLS